MRPCVTEAPVVPAAPVVSTEEPAKKKKAPKKESLGEAPNEADDAPAPEKSLRVFGRVFARASADERNDFTRSLSVPSARVGVSTSFEYVEAEVSADLSSKTMLEGRLRPARGQREAAAPVRWPVQVALPGARRWSPPGACRSWSAAWWRTT